MKKRVTIEDKLIAKLALWGYTLSDKTTGKFSFEHNSKMYNMLVKHGALTTKGDLHQNFIVEIGAKLQRASQGYKLYLFKKVEEYITVKDK